MTRETTTLRPQRDSTRPVSGKAIHEQPMTDQAAARARRFREVALPCLDDAYRLARFLMRNQADAEDAVQECYLRALRHFDSWRGDGDIKPWLLAILRNVCYGEFARRGRKETPVDLAGFEHEAAQPLWQEPPLPPDAEITNHQESAGLQQLIRSLPAHFREALVMREFNDMSYRDIAKVTGVPVGTVMSRLARARALLVWKARGGAAQQLRDADASIRDSVEGVADV
jgi:RNA polymerase sigma-70 factor (ECF subfamily)